MVSLNTTQNCKTDSVQNENSGLPIKAFILVGAVVVIGIVGIIGLLFASGSQTPVDESETIKTTNAVEESIRVDENGNMHMKMGVKMGNGEDNQMNMNMGGLKVVGPTFGMKVPTLNVEVPTLNVEVPTLNVEVPKLNVEVLNPNSLNVQTPLFDAEQDKVITDSVNMRYQIAQLGFLIIFCLIAASQFLMLCLFSGEYSFFAVPFLLCIGGGAGSSFVYNQKIADLKVFVEEKILPKPENTALLNYLQNLLEKTPNPMDATHFATPIEQDLEATSQEEQVTRALEGGIQLHTYVELMNMKKWADIVTPVDIKLCCPLLHICYKFPNNNKDDTEVEVEAELPKVTVQFPELKAEFPELKAEFPNMDFQIEGPHVEISAPYVDVQVPVVPVPNIGMEISGPNVSMKVEGPNVSMNASF